MSDSLRAEKMQFIVNLRAGGTRTGRIWADLTSQISKCNVPFVWDICPKQQDVKKIVRRGIKKGATTIVAVGGDGTFSSVLNAVIEGDKLLYPDIRLAYWPLGNSMNFANGLGFPKPFYKTNRFFDDMVLTKIDVGRAELSALPKQKKDNFIETETDDDDDDDDLPENEIFVRYFINSASCGLTAEIANQINKIPKLTAANVLFSIAYYLSSKEYQNLQMQIVADGSEIGQGRLVSASADNGCFRNGSLNFAPQAVFNDGFLDVVTVGDMDKEAAKKIVALAKKGRHMQAPGVAYRQAKEIKMVCDPAAMVELDGEIAGKTPAAFSVLPQMLSLWVPSSFVKK